MKTARNANIAAAMFPFRVQRRVRRVSSDTWAWAVLDGDGNTIGQGRVGSSSAARAAQDACKRAFVVRQEQRRREFLAG